MGGSHKGGGVNFYRGRVVNISRHHGLASLPDLYLLISPFLSSITNWGLLCYVLWCRKSSMIRTT